MSNKIKHEINTIDIPKDLSERSKIGAFKAKKEMQLDVKRYNVVGIAIVVSLLISLVVFKLFKDSSQNSTIENQNTPIVKENGSLNIPVIQFSKGNSSADMIGLIVYKGKIYTQTKTEIDAKNAMEIRGEELGITKGNINEWNNQVDYYEDFASTIGIKNVYAVKGYDKSFRIMTFSERDGMPYAEFYENLNGITIKSGKDLFGNLKMAGNIFTVKYRTFNDWNNSIDNYQTIADLGLLNVFVEELNNTKPLPRSENSDPIGNSRSSEKFRELTIQLNDGTRVKLILLKENYIYYGHMDAYFKMNNEIFSKVWCQLK
ncbi:MAG: hypothetical protein K0R71_1216 [Bacillales bacterium]|jgi:hypothetical protein|nr:hypothetical protein [Bacillales bacterium]